MSSYTIPREYGQVLQYQGPFDPGDSISFQEGQHNVLCKIGISIGEKDYMGWNDLPEKPEDFNGTQIEWENLNLDKINRKNFQSIPIKINDEQIEIGRTYMYEPGFPLSSLTISFPKGCPTSTLVEVVTMKPEE